MAYTDKHWQVSWRWINTADARESAHNVLHFATVATLDAGAVHATVAAALQSGQFDCLPNNCNVDVWTLTRLDGAGGPVQIAETVPEGGGNTDQVSPAVSAIVKLMTATGGRSGRGRIFLPMIAEQSQENGVLNGTNRDNMQDAWNAFITALDGDDVHLAVNSRLQSELHPVTNLQVEDILATQRRRQSRLRRV